MMSSLLWIHTYIHSFICAFQLVSDSIVLSSISLLHSITKHIVQISFFSQQNKYHWLVQQGSIKKAEKKHISK